jgi:hypothetical protein
MNKKEKTPYKKNFTVKPAKEKVIAPRARSQKTIFLHGACGKKTNSPLKSHFKGY